MPVVDTSFLVALFNATDAHHAEARKVANAATRLVAPTAIVAEFLQVVEFNLRRTHGAGAASRAGKQVYRDLERGRNLIFHPHDHVKAAAIYLDEPKLTYFDAAAVAVALSVGEELATYDADQLAAWKRRR